MADFRLALNGVNVWTRRTTRLDAVQQGLVLATGLSPAGATVWRQEFFKQVVAAGLTEEMKRLHQRISRQECDALLQLAARDPDEFFRRMSANDPARLPELLETVARIRAQRGE